jgi:hypothetical protein
MLIEQATGFLTGSVYNDPALRSIFIGEGRKNSNVIAIKAHPNVAGWDASKLLQSFQPKVPLMLIVRDPFKCMWSEGQRRMSRRRKQITREAGSVHTMQVTKKQLLNKENWVRWLALVIKLAEDYTKMWTSYETVIAAGSDYIFIPFERLTDPAQQGQTLHEMIAFLGSGFPAGREACAFVTSEHDKIRRKSPIASPELTNPSATFADAFPRELACQAWAALLPGKAVALRLGFEWTYAPPHEC